MLRCQKYSENKGNKISTKLPLPHERGITVRISGIGKRFNAKVVNKFEMKTLK